MPLQHYIPDWDRLIQTLGERNNHAYSPIHGMHHWMCVARIGHRLLQPADSNNAIVVLLFALFHDSMRINDGHDPEHGYRGALLAQELHGSLFTLAPHQLDALQKACREHTAGETTTDPTIGLCWDADRLDLWRVGIRPAPAYLSTPIAQQQQTILWSRSVEKQTHDWATIYALFDALM